MTDERSNILSPALADELIRAHDGDMALLCVYFARHPHASLEDAARDLCRTRSELEAADEKLGRLGTVRGEQHEEKRAPQEIALPPEDKPFEYRAQEIAHAFEQDPAFPVVRDELSQILGQMPSRAYLNTLTDMADHLAMPPEVILMLLTYCDEECKRRYGDARRLSAKFISDEAYRWHSREIMTVADADRYIAARARLRERSVQIAALLGIRGRELSRTEEKYINAWVEQGFDDELISLAYDRTLTNTGSLRWAYLDKILKNWAEKGIKTAADVEEKEPRPGKKAEKTKVGGRRITEVDEADLNATLNSLKGE